MCSLLVRFLSVCCLYFVSIQLSFQLSQLYDGIQWEIDSISSISMIHFKDVAVFLSVTISVLFAVPCTFPRPYCDSAWPIFTHLVARKQNNKEEKKKWVLKETSTVHSCAHTQLITQLCFSTCKQYSRIYNYIAAFDDLRTLLVAWNGLFFITAFGCALHSLLAQLESEFNKSAIAKRKKNA